MIKHKRNDSITRKKHTQTQKRHKENPKNNNNKNDTNDFRAGKNSVVAMNNMVKKHIQEKSVNYYYVVLFAILAVMVYW